MGPQPPLPDPRAAEHVVHTGSAAGTRRVAAMLADVVRPGDLLVLSGDLGAGKTTFCQGLGAALGVVGPITSPTFTLHHRYQGQLGAAPLVVHHLDVYRLDEVGQAVELGLPELLDSGALTLIEWGENILPALPTDYLEVRIELPDLSGADSDRVLRARCVGSSWLARFRVLGERLAELGPQLGPGPAEGEGGDPC